MKTRYITAIAAALMLCGCQREELAGTDTLSGKDGIVKFAPSVGGIYAGVKSSVSETVPAATRTQSLTLTSEDGTYTLPMSLSVTGMEAGMATKATLINETGALKSLGDFAASIDNTFRVAAWSDDETPVQIIPDAYARDEKENGNPENHGFKDGGYVSRTDDDGYYYQKVLYRTKDVSDNDLATPYWMTVQPQTADNFKTTIPDADDEYIWKKAEAKKRFYAYANVPTGATVALLAKGAGQTMTVNSIPADKDALLGYYYGDGSTASSEDRTGTASIRFSHPFTAVKFVQDGNLLAGATITSIEIEGAYSSGVAKMTPETATDPLNPKLPNTPKYRFNWDAEGSTTVSGSIGDVLLLIPQIFSSDSKSRIKVVITDGSSTATLYTPLTSGSWDAGCVYTYTIKFQSGGYVIGEPDEYNGNPLGGPYYVDLDLPSGNLWATCNLGANSPEEAGDFFMWGEVKGHKAIGSGAGAFTTDFTSFDHSDTRYTAGWDASAGFGLTNTPFHSGTSASTNWSKYIPSDKPSYWSGGGSPDNKTVLDMADDAAHVILGENWRMPTVEDFEELLSNTDYEWTSNYAGTGVKGYTFTSKTDAGKSMFLPATGYGGKDDGSDGCFLGNANSLGTYWSSSLSTGYPGLACRLFFDSSSVRTSRSNRFQGRCIRPVKN